MSANLSNMFKSALLCAALIGGASMATIAQAAPIGSPVMPNLNNTLNYGLLNFSAEASRKVDNDQTNATMTKVVQDKSSTEVARRISETLNQAVIIAKKYPQVQVSTGNQSTYPQYDKNQKINGWTGNASLNLKSTDTVAISKLIAELQSFMTLDGINFSVSDNTRRKVEQELMVEASTAFQNQAKALLPVWNARDYQLVSLDFNRGGDYGGRGYGVPMMAMASMKESAVANQDFQVGESTITVTANGNVQLMK